MRIRSYPGERLLFRFEKTIDDDGAALSRSSPALIAFLELEKNKAYGLTLTIDQRE